MPFDFSFPNESMPAPVGESYRALVSEALNTPETGVVARVGVPLARIPQTDNQLAGPIAAGTLQPECLQETGAEAGPHG